MKKLSLGLSSLMAGAALAAMAGAGVVITGAVAAPQPTNRRSRSKGKTHSAMPVNKQEVREWNAAVDAKNAMKQRRKASRKAAKKGW